MSSAVQNLQKAILDPNQSLTQLLRQTKVIAAKLGLNDVEQWVDCELNGYPNRAHQIKRFTALCGAALPAPLPASLEKYMDDDEGCAEFGIEYATKQCAELPRQGAPGLHFYTLNKARSTAAVVRDPSLGR